MNNVAKGEELLKEISSKISQVTPIVIGELVDKKTRVWCPYCKMYHFHGIEPDGTIGIGHRTAHCTIINENPFNESGYIIITQEIAQELHKINKWKHRGF